MYFFIIFVYRLMGKKEVGQLSIVDLIVSILIAELIALSIQEDEKSLLISVIPILVLVGVQILISYISLKNDKVRNIIDGKPTLIIKNGKLNFTEMSKLRYTLDDLLTQLRLQGVKSIDNVNVGDTTYSENISVSVASVSSTAATSLDENSVYVMRNTQYTTRYLTTSGTNVAASSANATVDYYGLVKVEGDSKIKSVVKGTYFNGTNSNVSFTDSGTRYTITDNGNNFAISYSNYYLKQTGSTSVVMQNRNSGNNRWYFYAVTIQ